MRVKPGFVSVSFFLKEEYLCLFEDVSGKKDQKCWRMPKTCDLSLGKSEICSWNWRKDDRTVQSTLMLKWGGRWIGQLRLLTSSPGSPALEPQAPKFPVPNPTQTHLPPTYYLWPIPPHFLLCKVNESARQEYQQRLQGTLCLLFTSWIHLFIHS